MRRVLVLPLLADLLAPAVCELALTFGESELSEQSSQSKKRRRS